MSYKDFIRKICPNYLPLRRYLSRIRVRQTYKYTISEKDTVAGEADPSIKKQIVEQCASRWPEKMDEVDKEASRIIGLAPAFKNQSDIEKIKTDMEFCFFAYGFQPDEYMFFALEGKNMEGRKEYISDMERNRMAYRMNDVIENDLFFDKWKTYEKFAAYFSREVIQVSSEEDYNKFDSFTTEHPVYVEKNTRLSRGQGVRLVNLPKVINDEGITKKEYFCHLIGEGSYILEERVEQGEALAALNPSSVNTVRCITFNTKNGIVVKYCFLRLGRTGSFVDNSGSGGIEVGIDMKTGQLNSEGFDKLGMHYEKHPDSEIQLDGYQLPDWDKLIKLCQEVAAKVSAVKYIGWDMAYSSKGWIVIEGNSMAQITGPQIVRQSGIKKEVEEIMLKMELMVP